jgi:nuclear pore complex protein Nup85
LADATGITAKWINDENISLFAYQHHLSSAQDTPTKFVNLAVQSGVTIHDLSVESILEDHTSLVNESASIFCNLQSIKSSASASEFMKISQNYRAVLRACLEKIRDQLDSDEGGDLDVEKYQHFVTVFYSIECVWHLCELLLIDGTSGAVVPKLLEWVKFHFPAAERMALEFLTQGRIVDSYEEFWPTVKGLVLQGEINMARAVLKLHLSSEKATFQLADQILKTMPVYSVRLLVRFHRKLIS